MARDKPLDELIEERNEHAKSMKDLLRRTEKIVDKARRLKDEAWQESDDLSERKIRSIKEAVEEADSLLEEVGKASVKLNDLHTRMDAGLENVRTAALETEKMLFEVGKLTATLAIGTIVAISAVTPALLPNLGSLEGLWPAFGWLLCSVAVSIVMCLYSMSQVSQLLANLRRRNRARLPDWASWWINALPYSLMLTLSVGALLIGLAQFAFFVSVNLGP